MKICETVRGAVALVWLYISERVGLYVSVSGCMYLNCGVKGLEVELYVLQVPPLCRRQRGSRLCVPPNPRIAQHW